MRWIFLTLYLLAGVGNLTGIITEREGLIHLFKPLLMPFLILHAAVYVRFRWSGRMKWLFMALFFCWLGDSFLMYQTVREVYFLVGLSSFLMGHLFYIVAYRRFAERELKGRPNNLFMVILLAYLVLVIGKIYPGLGDMSIPVFIYTGVILMMAVVAELRREATTGLSYWLVLSGALLFVISDSLIALNKFSGEVPLAGVWIMLTYITAQLLIVRGLITHQLAYDS